MLFKAALFIPDDGLLTLGFDLSMVSMPQFVTLRLMFLVKPF